MITVLNLVAFVAFSPLGALASPLAPLHDETPSIPPVVPATWISQNLAHPSLVVVDVRDAESYNAGHIPSSLSLPYTQTPLWYSMEANNTLVMPSPEVIVSSLGANGLLMDRAVVFVTNVTTLPTQMAMGTRAAATLRYVGIPIKSVAILDGGFPAWVASGLPVSTAPGVPRPGSFTGKTDASFVVDRAYVHTRLGKAAQGTIILDARPKQAFDDAHIESAVSLPGAEIWKEGGRFKSAEELLAAFKAVVGNAPVGVNQGEVIVYCWIGMLATTWFYVLSSILGFKNVKLYDGSFEDWTKEYQGVPSILA